MVRFLKWIRKFPWIFIFLAWVILYLPHLRTSPTWYVDETTNISICKALWHGEFRWESILFPFLACAVQPIYAFSISIFYGIFGNDIFGPRLLSSFLGLTIALVLFYFTKKNIGYIPALLAAICFLTYEQTVLHFRQVFHHGGVALGFTIAAGLLASSKTWKDDVKAGLGLVLACGSHPIAYLGCIATAMIHWNRPRKLLGIFSPVAFYGAILICFYHWIAPELWLSDIQWLMRFYAEIGKEQGGLFTNTLSFFTQDIFHMAGIIGWIIGLWFKKIRIYSIFALVTSIGLLANRSNLPLFYYQAVVLLPFIGIGWGIHAWLISRLIRNFSSIKPHRIYAYAILFLIPAFSFCKLIPQSLTGTLTPRNVFWYTQSIPEVEEAARWLNLHVSENDLVVSNTNITWLLNCHTSTFLQCVAWHGEATFSVPYPISKDRFIYDLDMQNVRFAVIGDLDWRWTKFQKNAFVVFNQFTPEGWEAVWRGPNYLILKNKYYKQP